ncbi:hypothetical protein EUGRSUZ_J00745 [Eucalyptus grandis]|uniref:Uncharacterized protein n=2 Tax=Eucalyptus grandis TaxID=71139 RepID=A0ACC3J347_EUCGR|nr:hypothetical protein EUGRSUZ_J00745 [Eucalyptus grandis]
MEIEAASGSGGGGAVYESKAFSKGTFLVWEDLSAVLPNFGHGHTKRLLQGLNGYAEPGRIMAIMGPSGSGKSTLLDSLAGRLSRKVIMTGNVLLDGKKKRLEYGVAAYVTQEDVLLGTLTVRETIKYSALLRLPTTMSKDEVNSIVEGTIIEMGLQDCADRVIGNWHLRGISGGEKKRLSIALEILTRPHLLFLDEPTSGLDSASAFFVVQTLRNIARDGRTVISSIHQPSSEVFALFDDLYLLSSGETVYFGEAKMAIEFFSEAGFPCPRKRNPSDHFLRCINSDFDKVTATLKGSQRIHDVPNSSDPFMNLATAEIRALLVEKYRCSKYAKRVKARIGEITTAVFYRERLNGYYGVAVFIISNFLSSFPFLVAITLTTGTITYHMVKFRPEFSHYVFFCLNIYACIAVIESLMMVVASLVPNFLMGIITGAGIIGILMMTSGFFRLLPDLPKPFWRYPISYLSYGSWAIQGAYKNDLLGLEFDPLIPGEPKLKGDVIITTMFGIQLDHSKWWDLSAIFIILIGYRLIFFAILKFKERASPVFNKIYAKSSLHQLDKRPSFRKVPSLSKRHQPLHSLSSQEGLNSPLH